MNRPTDDRQRHFSALPLAAWLLTGWMLLVCAAYAYFMLRSIL